MKLELKSIIISNSQSEETTAYTASLWIDGKFAYYLRNSGKGEMDRTYKNDNYDGGIEIFQVDAECKRLGFEDLEGWTALQLDAYLARQKVLRMVKTKTVTIEGSNVFAYKSKDHAKILKLHPDAKIVNDNPTRIEQAIKLLVAA